MQLSVSQIKEIREYFSGQPVVKAFVFGSYSRDEADADSDVDILVDLDYSHHIGLGFVQMKFDLEDKLNKKVDLVSSEGVSKYIKPFIDKDKLLVYER